MSRDKYVYEDPSIGAIISAVAVVDYALGETYYESYLKQTVKGPGDLSLVYKNAKVVLIEFKAPELATCNGRKCWKYEISQVKNDKIFNTYLQLASSGLLFLGLIHGLADPDGAPPNGKATFHHAPLTTAFVPPDDTKQILNNKHARIHVTRSYIYSRFLYRIRNCYVNLKCARCVTYRRDFVRCYAATCLQNGLLYNYTDKLETKERESMHVIDLATLLCGLIKCKFGIDGEKAMKLLKNTSHVLQKISHLYVLTSTLELIRPRDFINMMEGKEDRSS
jgi:hypothetical protein